MSKLWGFLKGLGIALLCNMGFLVVAGLCALPSLNSTTPNFFGNLGEALADWIGVLQLAYLGPLLWRRWQTQRIMALGLLMGVFLTGFLNYWIWDSNRVIEAEQPQFNYIYVHHASGADLRLSYSSFQKQGTGPFGRLDELFTSSSPRGVDLSQAKYFCATFQNPPYVKEYRFTFNLPTLPPAGAPKPVFVFSTTGDQDEVNSYDFTHVPLTAQQVSVTIKGEGHYFGLLRNKTIELELKRQDPKESYEDYRESPVYLTGLEVVYSAEPVVMRTMTVQEIESKYVKGRKVWQFDGWFVGDKDPLETEHLKVEGDVLQSLMALGLQGNKRAEELFYDYRLQGSASDEWLSGLKSWYDQTKKENGRLK